MMKTLIAVSAWCLLLLLCWPLALMALLLYPLVWLILLPFRLIGITFKMSGTFTRPNIIVNPLSIIAPGVFRQIFEY